VKIRSMAAVAAALVIALMAVGAPAWAASVSMVDFNFSPATVTIKVGDSVTWTNNATDPHTSTSDTGVWDSGTVNPGASFTHTFNSAGTFPYHCSFHVSLGMVGTVIVQAASTTPAPTSSSGGGGGGGGGSTATAGEPLPNTGASSSTAPFVIFGLLFLIGGGAVLYGLRRRRA
jgi:LPXTG-motif cell wall-anchored protein